MDEITIENKKQFRIHETIIIKLDIHISRREITDRGNNILNGGQQISKQDKTRQKLNDKMEGFVNKICMRTRETCLFWNDLKKNLGLG